MNYVRHLSSNTVHIFLGDSYSTICGQVHRSNVTSLDRLRNFSNPIDIDPKTLRIYKVCKKCAKKAQLIEQMKG